MGQKGSFQSLPQGCELIGDLKISEVMTRNVLAVPRNTTIREAQSIMKENSITGVPVVDSRVVVGIVSMNDIMNALESGRMDDPVTDWMTFEVQALAEEMPLSFAISAFSKYPFRRFPVVNKRNELAGIITFRNINLALIRELSRQLQEKNNLNEHSVDMSSLELVKEYLLSRYDFENGGKASSEIKKFLKGHGIPSRLIRRVAIASYELEINLVAHSDGGMLGFDINADRVVITSHDHGPGIADVDQALTEGFSTANEWIRSLGFGAGIGLPNIKRVSDEFIIQSTLGLGTMIRAVINIHTKDQHNN